MRKSLVLIGSLISLFVEISVSAQPVLNVNPSTDRNSLTLDGTGTSSTHIAKIADLTVSSVAQNGYTLVITSGNISKSDGQDIPYQVTAVNTGTNPTSGSFTVPAGSSYILCSTTTQSLDVYIRYTPASLQDPGLYSSVVSVTAEDNVNAC